MLRLQGCLAVCVALVIVFLVQAAPASTIGIQFSGLDIVYDGSAIVDAGVVSDELTTMSFMVDNSPAGPPLLSDIAADISVGPISGIPATGGAVHTGPNSGSFDLLTPDIGLALDLNGVTVTYLPVGFVHFVFAGSLANITGQDLPYGLTMGDPVTVSFSTQIIPGTVSDDGRHITGFRASGTGEVRGRLVPEPTTIAMAALAAMGLALCWRRKPTA